MNSDPHDALACQSIEELVTALTEGERTTYTSIIRSMEIPTPVFRNYDSWSDESYTRNCIVNTEEFELILICWEKGQKTPIHDHGGEECWVKVIDGEIKETIYTKDEHERLSAVKSTISKTNDLTYMLEGFHTLENVSEQRSMSLHLYAKPILNCQVFDEVTNTFKTKNLVYHTVSE